jgi:abortive infection bacteriophage resistance protein
MRYEKEPLTFERQIDLLESRGLVVSDKSKAANYLSNISYYRLSAYMLPFKVLGEDRFSDGTSFESVIDLYLFDREFRLLIFDTIEKLEIAFRTQMSYHVSLSNGPYWFEDRLNFRDADRWREQLESIDQEVDRAKEVFKDHFFEKYDEHERMPIWMTSEVLSLGLLSKMYRNLKMSPEKKAISKHFGLGNPIVLESWLQSMTYIRNICAHHSRLWNRVLTLRPNYLERPMDTWIDDTPQNDKMYYVACCFLYMLRSINPSTRFVSHFLELLNRYPDVKLRAMGFTDNWESQAFWQV